MAASNGVTVQNRSQDSRKFDIPFAPPHVYSCFVVNRTAESIDCYVKFEGCSGRNEFDEIVHVNIPGNLEHYFPRQFFQPDLPNSYCKWVKIITNIRVQKKNGTTLEAHYPFKNVRFPSRNWEFHVFEDGEIISRPPTRIANVLKYKNLDQHEC